jgi:hypothetical protein
MCQKPASAKLVLDREGYYRCRGRKGMTLPGPSEARGSRRLRAVEGAEAQPAPRPPESPPEQQPPHDLPLALSSFVGRERQIAEIERL